MVDARHGADHDIVLVPDRHEVLDGLGVVVVVPDDVGGRGDHAAPHVYAVHLVGVGGTLQVPDREAGGRAGCGVRRAEAQAIRVAGVDEQFLRGPRDQHVRLAGVDADVASSALLVRECRRQYGRVGKSLAENQSAPTQLKHDIVGHRLDEVRGRGVVQAERDGFAP